MQLNLVYYLTASVLGGLHALEPGHGKTVVAAYLVGSRGRKIDAVMLGLVVTLTHTSSVILLALAAKLASTKIDLTEEALHGYLGLVAGGLILAVGLWMLIGRLQGKDPLHFHSHSHGHDHSHGDHSHHHDLPHSHNQTHSHNPSKGHEHSHNHDHHNHDTSHDHSHEGHTHQHVSKDGNNPHNPGNAEEHHHDHDHDHDHDHSHSHAGNPGHEHHFHNNDHSHSHDHDHDHDHNHDHVHNHNPGPGHFDAHNPVAHHHHGPKVNDPTEEGSKRVGYWQLFLLGVSGGLVPCPAAIAVLLAAVAAGRLGEGLTYILLFSLGLAVVLILIGLTVVSAGKVAGRFLDAKKFARKVSIASAAIIAFIGLVTVLNSMRHVMG